MIQLGLRFQGSDARLLRTLEAQVRNGELGGQAANTFAQAAIAAESGEPLILHCVVPTDAVEMAAAYMRYGVARPVIEELSGT